MKRRRQAGPHPFSRLRDRPAGAAGAEQNQLSRVRLVKADPIANIPLVRLTAAGVDQRWRLHDLRHWSATTAIAQGHDICTVPSPLGHANPAMTLRFYARVVESPDRGQLQTCRGTCWTAVEQLGEGGRSSWR